MPKQVHVALLPQLLPADQVRHCTAVVIDTLRFTSTAAQALHAGAKSLRVVQDIPTALSIKAASPAGRDSPLLCGERHCNPIAGFDLGNSPLEYESETVGNRQLIFSTTNGTVAVAAARDAVCCFLGSLCNRSAVVRASLARPADSIWIICSGTDGDVAAEDVLAAGAMLDEMLNLTTSEPILLANDSAHIALNCWLELGRTPQSILPFLRQCRGGSNLIDHGYDRDITWIANLDSLTAVPVRGGSEETFSLQNSGDVGS